MEIENKFVVRGKVNKTFQREITTKDNKIFTEYYVVIEMESFDTKMYVSVLYREPQVAKEGDEVEASGFLVSRWSEKAETFFNTIRGKTLTVLKSSTSAEPICAPLTSQQPNKEGITIDPTEDVPF